MGGLESDTIGGFNSMLARQKEEPGECRLTTVLFDDQYELLHDRLDLAAVAPLTGKEYYVRGSTALLDAIGKTVQKISSVQKNSAAEYRAGKVLFIITTDGLENASREYTHAMVSELITTHRQEHGWEFLFLGANLDAVEVASQIGITASRAQRFHNDAAGIALNNAVLHKTVARFRKAMGIAEDWSEAIQADFLDREDPE